MTPNQSSVESLQKFTSGLWRNKIGRPISRQALPSKIASYPLPPFPQGLEGTRFVSGSVSAAGERWQCPFHKLRAGYLESALSEMAVKLPVLKA